MGLFYKRPLLLGLSLFLTISVIGTAIPHELKTFLLYIFSALTIVFILTYAFIFCFKRKKHNLIFNCSLFSIACASALIISINFFDFTLKEAEELTECKSVIATIEECSYRAEYLAVYTATIESIDGEEVNFKAEISTETDLSLDKNDRIYVDMTFAPFEREVRGFDERTANISNGILVSATFSNAELLESNNEFGIASFFNAIRDSISKRIDKSELEKSAPLIKALLIGDKSDLDSSVKLNFRRLGISHILAISGAHFTILLGLITVLLYSLGINKKIIYFILIPVAFFYMGLSGFSYSVCRAGIMAILTYIAFLYGQSRDSYTALFFATSIIIAFSPHAVMSIGLWLSFTATFTILILIDVFKDSFIFKKTTKWYFKLASFLVLPILISVCVSFATLPIISLCFGEISLFTPIANMLIVPLIEIFLYIIPFTVLLINLTPLTNFTEWMCDGILNFSQSICQTDNLLISVKQDFVPVIAIIGIITTLVLVAIPLKRRYLVLLPCLISILSIAVGISVFFIIHYEEEKIVYYNSGISDGLLLLDNNKTLCIDVSNGGSNVAYYGEYVSDINYCPEISGYMFTHYHTLHVNQFKKLAGRTKVQNVYLPKPFFENDEELYDDILSTAKELKIPIITYEYGKPFSFEDYTITVFEPGVLKRSTHESVSLKIASTDCDVLYLGSSFSETSQPFDKHIKNADHIIFGQHHPISKNKFEVRSNATKFFGSEEIFSLSEQDENAVILKNDTHYDIILK